MGREKGLTAAVPIGTGRRRTQDYGIQSVAARMRSEGNAGGRGK
jgi:hypothetical protein